MKEKTSYITLCAVTAALITAVMAVSYFPYLTYAVPALAGALIIIPLVETGKGYAFITYIVSSVLVMLFAEPEARLMYICFFGYYPILKAILEKIKVRVIEYLLKLIIFNGAVTLVYLVFAKLFGIATEGIGEYGKYGILILYIVGNIAFIFYDICLARLCVFYFVRIGPKIKKIMRK